MRLVGFDLGGTDLKAAWLRGGEVAAFARVPSRISEGRQGPMRAMHDALEALGVREDDLDAIGVGCPGVIDPDSGVLRGETAHLPHWLDFPLRAEVSEHFDLPVAADNDANAAALAEHAFGGGRGARSLVLVTLGTGIGCGIVLDGRIHRGAWGGAGEIGHVPLGDGALECRCGVPGCVEPEASGSGLVRAAAAAGLAAANAEEVFALAARGDATAARLLGRFSDRLGATLATVIAVLNPDRVLVGGGLSNAGDALLEPLRESVRRYGLPSLVAGLTIERAALGDRAGAIGAAWMAATLPRVAG